MTLNTGRRWWVYSKRHKEFEAIGYSKPGDDHMDDALKAMEMLAKHLKRPIPTDINLTLLGTDQ